jgi:hypothetical protein
LVSASVVAASEWRSISAYAAGSRGNAGNDCEEDGVDTLLLDDARLLSKLREADELLALALALELVLAAMYVSFSDDDCSGELLST